MQRGRLLIVSSILAVLLFAGGLFWAAVIVGSLRDLPYEFTYKVYNGNQFEVCPGDVVEWTPTAIVSGRLQIIAANAWLDPATQHSELIDHTGRQLLFTDRSLLHDYYTERGRDFNLSLYPITVSETYTATVPAMVEDGPLLIVFTIIYSDKEGDTYTVPFYVLDEDECLSRPSSGGRSFSTGDKYHAKFNQ